MGSDRTPSTSRSSPKFEEIDEIHRNKSENIDYMQFLMTFE